MKTFALLCCLALAACGGAPKSAAKKAPPRTTPIAEHQRVPVPDGWKDEADAESKLIGAPCDIRLASPSPDTEICLKVGPTQVDPFQELDPVVLEVIRRKFESDGWTDIKVSYDPARQLMGYAGTKTLDLRQDGKPSAWRVRYLRADLSGDPGLAVMLIGVAPAANAAEIDAAVDAIDASLKPVAPAPGG